MTCLKNVAFLGPIGTYSHKAVLQYFGDDDAEKYKYVPYPTIASCFDALANREVDYAVVPFSNSTNGPVTFTFDLLRQSDPRPTILGDEFVSVEHYVLASPAAASNVSAHGEAAIKVIYSHPQVWGQCDRYLKTHFTNARHVDCDSTALAATLAAKNPASVAIAALSAATDVDVAIYAERIQDSADNRTRFLVIQAYDPAKAPTALDASVDAELSKGVAH